MTVPHPNRDRELSKNRAPCISRTGPNWQVGRHAWHLSVCTSWLWPIIWELTCYAVFRVWASNLGIPKRDKMADVHMYDFLPPAPPCAHDSIGGHTWRLQCPLNKYAKLRVMLLFGFACPQSGVKLTVVTVSVIFFFLFSFLTFLTLYVFDIQSPFASIFCC